MPQLLTSPKIHIGSKRCILADWPVSWFAVYEALSDVCTDLLEAGSGVLGVVGGVGVVCDGVNLGK